MVRVIPILLILSACSAAPIGADRAVPGLVVVGDQRFAVYRTAFDAAAFRVGPGPVPRLDEVRAAGAEAIALATGCPVATETVMADHTLVRAGLDCAGVPPRAPQVDLVLDCAIFEGPFGDSNGLDTAEIDCALYFE